eukprot:g160.t1
MWSAEGFTGGEVDCLLRKHSYKDKAEQVLAERFGVKVGDVLYFPPSPSGKKTDSAASKYKGEMKGEALRDFANSLIE